MAVVAAPPMKLSKAAEARKLAAAGKAPGPGGGGGRARVLVTVTAIGSAGPLRFLVDEGETVTGLIRAALRCYAREGRMPLLGADPAAFLLYTATGGSGALNADERISFNGCRSFLLWHKTARQAVAGAGAEPTAPLAPAPAPSAGRKGGGGGWKVGLNKLLLSFSIKV
ncbi:hypothetical protein BS78_08G129000 [Paspalum vaginatum]|nr:hypothetical protein BS78_08G129000 [Paspalum vaginatum]